MDVIGIKTCDACRKAIKALEKSGREVTFRDIRETPLTMAEATRFLFHFKDALVNRRSATWRELSKEDRELPPLELLIAHPTIMKRPVIVDGTDHHLGWAKDVQAALL